MLLSRSARMIVLGLAAATATLQSYHVLTGRAALRDTAAKVTLARRSLVEWDAICAANQQVAEIVLCLTTTPSRIKRLHGTLKSLLYQTQRARSIRLHIPEFSRREQVAYQIPEEFLRLQCIEIVRCADHGPATKLLPALDACAPHQAIIVVDDDRLYPPDFIATFAQWAQRLPHAAFGLSGWRVPADCTDRALSLYDHIVQRPPAPIKSTRLRYMRQVDILMGYTGYLVRPAFFDHAAIRDYSAAPAAAFYVDDVWMSAHCQAPKYVVPSARHCFIPRKDWFFHDRNALYRINAGDGIPEQRNTTIMIRYFKDRWLTPM